MPKGLGKTQKRILLLLQGGIGLVFAGTPGRQMRLLKEMDKEWKKIEREALSRSIRSLYRSQLIQFQERGGGRVEMELTKEGKKKTLDFDIDNLSVKKQPRWDGKWRIVSFDIPKDEKKAREAFRAHLRRMGFSMLHKSVFVIPYPCGDEIDFLIECFELRQYVRQILAQDIDNALHLKQHFQLL
ncbi:MAG: CRISPR-associated endonuclease Cas2 [Candidatus Liptonbacteria bacterium]|nr:CRISPR-associated endonuclease Cas2 [Candidatus Liptonbacteria bacterium]